MIDFKDNIFYFGDGDILVNNSLGGLMFVNCKPPLEVGTELNDEIKEKLGVKYTSDWITIPITTYDEAKYFGKLLDEVLEGTTHYFYFKDYQFNFSNWNPKSIESIKRHLAVVRGNLLMRCAC